MDPTQAKLLEIKLEKIIDCEKDSLRFYFLGKSMEGKIKHIGAKKSYDITDAIII